MTKTVYFQEGNAFFPTAEASFVIQPRLLPGNYVIRSHPMRGPFFERTDDFVLPPKMYGDTTRKAQRILATFQDRVASTGVLLDGEKGSGKTLLAKYTSVLAAESGIPTILINSPQAGDGFNKLMQDIQQPCIVLFDEFEKTYANDEAQQAILTLLDGVFPTKKLFILTVNNKWKINEHMRNRPGRLYYSLSYDGIGKQFVQDYCADNLQDKSKILSVVQASLLFSKFNFDMLKAIVEEMNRYGETAQQVMQMLNTRPGYESGGEFAATMTQHGVPVTMYSPRVFSNNPLRLSEISFSVVADEAAMTKIKKAREEMIGDLDPDCWDDDTSLSQQVDEAAMRRAGKKTLVVFTAEDLKVVDSDTESYTFVNKQGYGVTFKRKREAMTGYDFYSRALWSKLDLI